MVHYRFQADDQVSFWHRHLAGELTLTLILGLVLGAFGTYYYLQSRDYEVVIQPPETELGYTLQYGSYPEMADEDFFSQVRDQFIESQASFIEADLTRMEMTVYHNGQPEVEVEIAAKGREGSWWETPAGLYQVQSKTPSHFSSLASVHMPWSIHFHGNFFIHGWPYHPGGRPVASDFSGGCIRLTDQAGKTVYRATQVGMPVLVHETELTDQTRYASYPDLSADSFLAIDLLNNFVFFDQNSEQSQSLGALVHLLSALVAVEHISLNSSSRAWIDQKMMLDTPRPRLQAGQEVTFYNLLFPLLMEQSNEAAKSIAAMRGQEQFLQWLNKKSTALGMDQSQIRSVSSQETANLTTARDLMLLIRHIYHNRRFVLEITALDDRALNWQSVYGQPLWRDLENLSKQSDLPGFQGGLIDHWSGADSAAVILEIEFSQQPRPILFIVLDSSEPTTDIGALRQAVEFHYSLLNN